MMRSRVDLPEPERPSRPTISPSRKLSDTSSRTTSSAPEGWRKAWRMAQTSSSGVAARMAVVVNMGRALLVEAEATLGEAIEPPPQRPVEQHDEERHRGDAEHDARIVAG